MPSSVRPWRSIAGITAASRPRAVASSAAVSCVGSPSVCERVAREKSSNRSRRITVRQTRCARRSRRARRSTSATSCASSAACDRRPRPSARCVPIERRRRPTTTGRGSRLWASAWRWRPAARPRIPTSAGSPSAATFATVVIPRACSLLAVAGPTPHSRSTGSGCRNASSPAGGTTSSPSGFASPLATFARNFVRATPTVIGRPTCASTRRLSRTAMSAGAPAIRSIPRTSRNASSIDSPSTCGDVSSKIANTALLASEYALIRGGTTIARGHSRRAVRPPIAVRTPCAFAS